MKLSLSSVFCTLLALFSLLHGDETAPSPRGRSFTVSGKITHFKLSNGVTVEGATEGGTPITVLDGIRNEVGDAQVHLHHVDSPVPQPIRSLVAFEGVAVPRVATVNVDFDILVERFHYWSVAKNKYVVDPGDAEIQVGASSSDIRQTCAVTV
jgi:hypothetical protein